MRFIFKAMTALLALPIIASIISCNKPIEVQQTLFAFGTEINIHVLAENKAQANLAIREIEDHFEAFNQDWHAWQEGSTLFNINQAIKRGQSIEVNQAVKTFILKSQRLAQQSNNLFDPAIGQLIALWGFHSEDWAGQPPAKQIIGQYVKNKATIHQIHFKGLELHCTNAHVQLDFGGNVKGLALKQAAQILQNNGIHNGIINIGGDMFVLGKKYEAPWRIGIQNPRNPTQVIAQISAQNNMAVVTSGTYQRFFEWQGKRYSHLLNPNTGYPADTFASVTVVHADATRADAAATALLIAGKNEWTKIAQQMQVDKVYAIDHDGKTYSTHSIRPLILEFKP